MGGHSIFGLAGMGRKYFAATDATAGRKSEPGSEMVASPPSTQIRAALGNQPKSQVGADAGDLGQINTDQLIEQGISMLINISGFA